jgi:hypothetical protein
VTPQGRDTYFDDQDTEPYDGMLGAEPSSQVARIKLLFSLYMYVLRGKVELN